MIWFFLMGFIAGVGCTLLYGKHVSEKLEAELDKIIKKAQEEKKDDEV